MKQLRINIILPGPATKPGGGTKVMYEYANRLHERGHQVAVIHSIRRPFKKMKSPLWLKQLKYRLQNAERPSWFPLHTSITSRIVPQITNEFLPDADVVLSTWWEMTYMISRLDMNKGKPFNLIQDYEIWTGNTNAVHQSYKLPVHHLVIARYLQKLVQEHSGITPVHIPNAINTSLFKITTPLTDRKHGSVIMLYSQEPRKGTSFGLEALYQLKKKIPLLSVTLFGVFDKPDLPDWITYHKKPTHLPELLNQHAIFLSPSLGEGWALPPAEAMSCGCAVVCTNIGGHADYAMDHETALLVEPKNMQDIQGKVLALIQDDDLRLRIAEAGNNFIQGNFSWKLSVDLLENAFYSA